tara:strand:+ start:130 stop:510 length:381 start_codon:yes stop_codon:yes gene_type:complete
MLELQSLLTTLSKVSGERILPECGDKVEEGDLCRVSIPVLGENFGDSTDAVLRRYAKDWVKKQGRFNVEATFRKAKTSITWESDDGTKTPLYGVIILSWWPRPPSSERDDWERDKAARKAARFREH